MAEGAEVRGGSSGRSRNAVQGGRRSRSAGRWRRKEQVAMREDYMYFLNLEYLSQSTNLTLYLKL